MRHSNRPVVQLLKFLSFEFRTLFDAMTAHASGIEVYVVGVTSVVNETEITLMSSRPQRENETYWLLPDFQSFDQILGAASDRVCTGKTILSRCPHIQRHILCWLPSSSIQTKIATEHPPTHTRLLYLVTTEYCPHPPSQQRDLSMTERYPPQRDLSSTERYPPQRDLSSTERYPPQRDLSSIERYPPQRDISSTERYSPQHDLSPKLNVFFENIADNVPIKCFMLRVYVTHYMNGIYLECRSVTTSSSNATL